MKSKVLIFGATGMLGHKLYNNLPILNKNLTVIGVVRSRLDKKLIYQGNSNKIKLFKNFYKKKELEKLFDELRPKIVINALGIIKQKKNIPNEEYLYFNSVFPRLLECILQKRCKIINISTDCVFDGSKGNYSEKSIDFANDIYGMTKYLGEIKSFNNLTIRTSIIGHEIKNKVSLLEWFLNNKSKKVDGYKNVFFSGVTTTELTRIINIIIKDFYNLNGVYNISSKKISKSDLLKMINKTYNLKKIISPKNVEKLDRSLNSKRFSKATSIKINSWEKMIIDMFNDSISEN